MFTFSELIFIYKYKHVGNLYDMMIHKNIIEMFYENIPIALMAAVLMTNQIFLGEEISYIVIISFLLSMISTIDVK